MKSMKAAKNFVSMANNLRSVDGDTDSVDTTDTELWLVQVPQGFDVSALNKLDTSVLGLSGGTQTLKVKTEQDKKIYYSVAAFRESADCKKMSTVVTGANGQISLGGDVKNMLVVTETAAHCAWHADSAALTPKKPVPMPSGLKARYTPFGADTPCPSVCRKHKKRKKHASKAAEESTEEHIHQDFKESSKKRKREASPDGGEEPSPKKKKKKSKHRHSDLLELQTGDVGNTDSNTASPTSKHKRRKSEGVIQRSSAGEASFVIDTTGDHELLNNNTKHKTSRKDKHRRTL